MPLQLSPTTTELMATIVYGTFATIIGVVTIYQGRRAWMMWYEYRHHHENQVADVERGRAVSRNDSILLQNEEVGTDAALNIHDEDQVDEIVSQTLPHAQSEPSLIPLGPLSPTRNRNLTPTLNQASSHGSRHHPEQLRISPPSRSPPVLTSRHSSDSFQELADENRVTDATIHEGASKASGHSNEGKFLSTTTTTGASSKGLSASEHGI